MKINDTTATARRSKDGIILRPHKIAPPGFEFPRYNPRYQSKPYQYVYGTGTYDEGPYRNSVSQRLLPDATRAIGFMSDLIIFNCV